MIIIIIIIKPILLTYMRCLQLIKIQKDFDTINETDKNMPRKFYGIIVCYSFKIFLCF